jgi:16S rRNA (guanine527-N7)-methyltransferase
LEAAARRCEFLREAIRSLGLEARLEVAEGRAEILAREPALTGTFDLVTARSFGRPGVTAECAARLLSDSGLLLVADPPIDQVPVASRWPAGGLEQLGLRLQDHLEAPAVAVIAREGSCPDRYPRRSGVPEKRPIF